MTEAVVFPMGVTDQTEGERRVEAAAQQFYEGPWLQRPLRSLGGTAPIDAAGHAVLRRKVRGVIQFLPGLCGRRSHPHLRLRSIAPQTRLDDDRRTGTGTAPADISVLSALRNWRVSAG